MSWKNFLLLPLLGLSIANTRAEEQTLSSAPLYTYSVFLPNSAMIEPGSILLSPKPAVGISPFLQLSTDLQMDLSGVLNARLKTPIIQNEQYSLLVSLTWQRFNYESFDPNAPDQEVMTWIPALSGSYSLAENLSVSAGASLGLSNRLTETPGLPISGLFMGSALTAEIAWVYTTTKTGKPCALALGITRDFSYQGTGYGISHYFGKFKIGLNYYPDATVQRLRPNLAGGIILKL